MFNILKSLPIACILIILTSCATAPSKEKLQAAAATVQLPAQPEQGKAMVYVVRPGIFGTFIRFNVFVDDKSTESNMGSTQGRKYIYFNIEPGRHTIFSKAENWVSVDITAKEGEIIFLEQEAAMGVIMARNTLKRISEDEGKYSMQKLSVGKIKKLSK